MAECLLSNRRAYESSVGISFEIAKTVEPKRENANKRNILQTHTHTHKIDRFNENE